jgi:FAD/FMN-containing dehydrogenases
MVKMHAWGCLESVPHDVNILNSTTAPLPLFNPDQKGLAYGNGRSYGDVCINKDGGLWLTNKLNHFIEFDEINGTLTCEAGVLLQEIQRVVIPRGWILPVTPGTQLITVGGAIANDIHGKSHHSQGAFGHHVLELTLVRTDGEIIICGPDKLPDWFAATVGGIGLTGVIVKAKLGLRRVASPWLETENVPYKDLDGFFELSESSEKEWENSVSWVDCITGNGQRGIFMRGNFIDHAAEAKISDRKLAVPCMAPISLVNRLTLRPFNMMYYQLQAMKTGRRITHYEPFFYPLDNILEWNRIYGPHGFFQYQSVVPPAAAREAVKAMQKQIARSGDGSFLGVIKTFGNKESIGMLSFPQPGVTLALDFPNNGARTLRLFNELDAIVREAEGRMYLAKDARMPKDLFEKGYPRLNEFLTYRDPGISSSMSRRLMGY